MFAAIAGVHLGEEDLDFGTATVAFVLRFAIGMSTGHSFTFLHNALHALAHLVGGGGHTEAVVCRRLGRQLAVLDVGFLVDEVVLVGNALLRKIPVGSLVKLALERPKSEPNTAE